MSYRRRKFLTILLILLMLAKAQYTFAESTISAASDTPVAFSTQSASMATTLSFPASCIEIKKGTTIELPKVNMNGTGTVEWFINNSTIISLNKEAQRITAIEYGTSLLTAYIKEDDSVYACTTIKVIPNNAGLAVYEGTISERFEALKQQFPHQKYWNNHEYMGEFDPNGYTDIACSSADHKAMKYCGYFGGGMQCWGFANRIAFGLFGSYPDGWGDYGIPDSNGWVKTQDTSVIDYLEPGDWVRIKHTNGEHSFVVWKISGSTVYCVEGNWSGRCMIQWGKTRSLSSIKSNLLFVYKHPESQYRDKFISVENDSPGEITVDYEIIDGEAWIDSVNFSGSKSWTVADYYYEYPVVGFNSSFSWKASHNLSSVQFGINIRDFGYIDDFLYLADNISYSVQEDNMYFCAVDGAIYTKDMKKLMIYPYNNPVKTFIVPEGVEEFSSCDIYASKIILPSTFQIFDSLHSLYCQELAVAPESPYLSSKNGMILSKNGKNVLVVPSSLEGYISIPDGAETYRHTNQYDSLVVAPPSLELWNGWLDGYTIILNGCNLKMSSSFSGTGEVENLVFLNNATIEPEEHNTIEATNIYAPKNSFGELFAEEIGANFIELKLTLDKQTLQLNMSQSQYISASMPYMTEAKTAAAWSSADPSVAMVNRHGLVTAISSGETVITASMGEAKATCRVIVNPVEGIHPFKLPSSLTYLESEAFCDSDIDYVICPDGLEFIAANAFKNCTTLSKIVVPGMATQIHPAAFSGCSDDLVIITRNGSAAHQFALLHNYPYSLH